MDLEFAMKKIILSASFLLLTAMFFGSCSDHSVTPPEPEFANGRVVGTVRGVISDYTTNTPFDSSSVLVTWIDNGKTHSTMCKNSGYYYIDSLSSGTHEITFTGPSTHSVSRITVKVPELNEILDCCPATNKNYHHSVTQNISLYKRSNHVEGRIFYQKSLNNLELAQGVTVVADYRYVMDCPESISEGYNVIPARYNTTTNSSGFFSFDSLPCTPSVIIKTLPYTNSGVEYSPYLKQIPLEDGSSHSMGDMVIYPATNTPIIVQSNFIDSLKFPINEDFIATFSKKMDPSTFEISLYNGGTRIETSVSWTDSITMTISHFIDLRPDRTYTLSIKGKSKDNYTFDKTYTIHTQAGIEFLSTNLEISQGIMATAFPVENNIELTFSMAVNLSDPDNMVELRDENNYMVDFTVSLSADQKTLIINPVGNLEYDQTYTLKFEVHSSIPDDYVTNTETGLSFVFTTESAVTVPSQVTGFALNMGSGWKADYNTTSISFIWNSVTGADKYLILAKDNHKNTDYVYIKSFNASDNITKHTGSINLQWDGGGQFDYYDDDFIITPFCGGNEISFYIAAVNDAGRSILSAPVIVKDETSPAMELLQYVSANNSSSSSVRTIAIDLNGFGSADAEYLDTDYLNISVTEAGGDASYAISASDIRHEWYINGKGVTLYIDIPAGKDGSGDRLTVNCRDNSGNSTSVSATLM